MVDHRGLRARAADRLENAPRRSSGCRWPLGMARAQAPFSELIRRIVPAGISATVAQTHQTVGKTSVVVNHSDCSSALAFNDARRGVYAFAALYGLSSLRSLAL